MKLCDLVGAGYGKAYIVSTNRGRKEFSWTRMGPTELTAIEIVRCNSRAKQ